MFLLGSVRFVGFVGQLHNLYGITLIRFQPQATGQILLDVKGVAFVVVGCVAIEGVLCDVVFIGKERADAPELENTFASVQDCQLVHAHQLFAELLIIEIVGHLAAPALAGVVGVHGFFSQGRRKLF